MSDATGLCQSINRNRKNSNSSKKQEQPIHHSAVANAASQSCFTACAVEESCTSDTKSLVAIETSGRVVRDGSDIDAEDVSSWHRHGSVDELDLTDSSEQTSETLQTPSATCCVLRQSLENWKPFDIMDTATRPPSSIVSSLGESSSRSLTSQESSSECDKTTLFLKSLHKLARVLHEFLQTEVKFSLDVHSLKTVLTEIKYSTLSSARHFVSAASYVGIVVSTESIKITSDLLVSLIQEATLPPTLDSSGRVVAMTDVAECFDCCHENCLAVFNGLERCAPFFPMFASFILHHDGLSSSYRDASLRDEGFQQYMRSTEILVGEGLLSLLIKPVQRLPRYVLLCREIHSSLAKALSLLDDTTTSPFFARLTALHASSQRVLESMAGYTATCNEAVRQHQDNLRMHSLQQSFVETDSEDLIQDLVSDKRRILLEGQLLRHHRRGGMRVHEFQLFSDVVLSSAPAGLDGCSLQLEHVVMLHAGSDTVCYPIPAMFESGAPAAASTWFFVCAKKILFCCAESVAQRDRWVQHLSACLLSNQADSDHFLMKKQIALVNGIISQINLLWQGKLQLAAKQRDKVTEKVTTSTSTSPGEGQVEAVNVQVSWWRLLGVLQRLEGEEEQGGHAASESLQRVADMHAQEVTSRILESAQLDIAESAPQSAHFHRPCAGQVALTALLQDGRPHYLVASGFFYEAGGDGLGSGLRDGVRPLILRLFLLSDVLLALYFDTVGEPLRYAFHIKIEDMECSDYRTDVGPTAIQLVDTSVSLATRRFSLFSCSSDKKHTRERIIFAPTFEMKFDWLTLIMQTVECHRNALPSSAGKGAAPRKKFGGLRVESSSLPLPLRRVCAHSSTSPWEFESKSQ